MKIFVYSLSKKFPCFLIDRNHLNNITQLIKNCNEIVIAKKIRNKRIFRYIKKKRKNWSICLSISHGKWKKFFPCGFYRIDAEIIYFFNWVIFYLDSWFFLLKNEWLMLIKMLLSKQTHVPILRFQMVFSSFQ